MEGKCQDVLKKVFYIYNNAFVLGKVWPRIPAAIRQESIDRLRLKTVELKEKAQVREIDSNLVYNELVALEIFNSGEGESHDLGVIEDRIIEMAIHAIADCECTVPLKER